MIPWLRKTDAITMKVSPAITELISLALKEDVGSGDLTAQYFVSSDSESCAEVVAREPLVISGLDLVPLVCRQVDEALTVELLAKDGQAIKVGECVLRIQGKSASILTAERTVLNFLQRLSGVATLTGRYVAEIKNSTTQLLDTRKTTPGWRELEKYAVTCGGGQNHRMGLFDRVMVKDNHIQALGGVMALQAYVDTFKKDHPAIPIEVEVDTLEQLEAVLKLREIDFILLDNMDLDTLKLAVSMRKQAGSLAKLEASGGVNLSTIGGISETGVDFISVGGLTHSAVAVDLGMDFI